MWHIIFCSKSCRAIRIYFGIYDFVFLGWMKEKDDGWWNKKEEKG
jgi:hypothetical protein